MSKQPIVKVFNHRTGDVKTEIKIKGKLYPVKNNSDAEVDALVKRLGLWRKGEVYPDFEIYEDGEQAGGGGGPNSGTMDRAPRVKVFNHRAKDANPAIARAQALAAEVEQKMIRLEESADIMDLPPEERRQMIERCRAIVRKAV